MSKLKNIKRGKLNMKNKIRTIIVIAVLLVAMVALTACSNNKTENNVQTNEPQSTTPPPKPVSGENAPPDEGQAPKEKIPPPEGAEVVPPPEGEEGIPAEKTAE